MPRQREMEAGIGRALVEAAMALRDGGAEFAGRPGGRRNREKTAPRPAHSDHALVATAGDRSGRS
jgi:hypothetical protein